MPLYPMAFPSNPKSFFSGISIVAKFAFHPDGTVNRYLTNLVDIQLPPSSTPISGVTSYDHTLDSARNLWFRVFIPADLSYSSLPVILYFHGGGFVSFSPAKLIFNALCQKLAGDLAAIYISVAYRRSPENCWPAQYDDGFDVLRFLDDDFDILANADLSRCFLAGDSAGGNIAHHVAVRACESEAQFKTVRIRGLIGIQPFFGGKERTESELQMKNHGLLLNLDHTDFYWEAFLPNGWIETIQVRMCSGQVPWIYLVWVGSRLPLWLLVGWQGSGVVEYPNMGLGFYVAPELPETQMLFDK
ncbi:putative carboxylesterase 18, partial [Bienertia sinuspersici]